MQFVLDGLFTLGIALAGLWVWSVRGSITRDKADGEAARRKAQEAAQREARLARKGEPLRCLSCDKKFRGPLPEAGCPRCGLASFVMPETEYCERQERKAD